MKSVFADADYWVALLNPQEELNEKAKRVSAQLQPVRIVTSEMVLVEVLNLMGSRGQAIRSKACEAIRRLRENPNVTVVPQTSIQFGEALAFFCGHPDKEWSQTDCGSFLIMREADLNLALTYDHHYQQAGFIALLRGPD